MKEETKKRITLITSILLLVVAVLTVVFSFTPVAKFKTTSFPMSETFTEGSYTQDIPVAEFEFGIGKALDIFKDFSYFSVVIKTQSLEQDIRNLNESIADLLSSDNYDSDRLDEYREDLAEAQEDLAKLESDLTEADRETIEALLHDDTFVNSLALYYGIGGVFDSIGAEFSAISSTAYNISMLRATLLIFVLLFIAELLIGTLILCIVTVIRFLVDLIACLVRIKNYGFSATDKLCANKMLPILVLVPLIGLVMIKLIGTDISVGYGLIVLLVLLLVSSAIQAVVKILFAEKTDRMTLIVKQSIATVSLIAVILAVVGYNNLSISEQYLQNAEDFGETYYDTVYDDAIQDGKSSLAAEDLAKEETKSAMNPTSAILLAHSLIFGFLLFFAFSNATERFGTRKVKNKEGLLIEHSSMRAIGIILLIGALIVPFLGVSSPEDRRDAYEDGTFKILWNEYEHDDTKAKTEYDTAVFEKEALQESIKEQIKEIDKASDKDERTQLQYEKWALEQELTIAENEIDRVETSHTAGLVLLLVGIVLFAACEFFYKHLPPYLEKTYFKPEVQQEAS